MYIYYSYSAINLSGLFQSVLTLLRLENLPSDAIQAGHIFTKPFMAKHYLTYFVNKNELPPAVVKAPDWSRLNVTETANVQSQAVSAPRPFSCL